MSDGTTGPTLGLRELASLYPFGRDQPAALLELCFGQTVASRPLLEENPRARLVVFIPDAKREERARDELATFKDRVRFVRTDPGASTWVQVIPRGFHFITISWGLEEMIPAKRPDLIRRLSEKLAPGGILAILAAIKIHAEHLDAHYRDALRYLGTEGTLPKDPEEDQLPSDGMQLKFFLEASALRPADLYWKLGPYALFFGMRAI